MHTFCFSADRNSDGEVDSDKEDEDKTDGEKIDEKDISKGKYYNLRVFYKMSAITNIVKFF